MVKKGNQDLLINIGIVVLVIVVIYVVIIRNPNALNWLKGTGRKTGAVRVGAVAGQAVGLVTSAGATVPLAFPSTPGQVGNHATAEIFGDATRQEGEIGAGGAHVEGVYCAYHTHSGVGDDEYSWKFGFGGGGGEWEQIIKMGGNQEAGGRWEQTHNDYSDVPAPEKVSDLPGMSDRVSSGLVTGFDNQQQGFQVVKTRSPQNDANVWDVFVDDIDGQGWKYAFTKVFDDANYNQQGRGYEDSVFRLEIRYQDMGGTVDYSDLNYHEGRVQEYTSPLYGESSPTTPPPPPSTTPPEEDEDEDDEDDDDDEEETEGSCDGSTCRCANGTFFLSPPCNNDQCNRTCSSSANQAKVLVFTSKRHLRLGNIL